MNNDYFFNAYNESRCKTKADLELVFTPKQIADYFEADNLIPYSDFLSFITPSEQEMKVLFYQKKGQDYLTAAIDKDPLLLELPIKIIDGGKFISPSLAYLCSYDNYQTKLFIKRIAQFLKAYKQQTTPQKIIQILESIIIPMWKKGKLLMLYEKRFNY